jgi:hypothetical protein
MNQRLEPWTLLKPNGGLFARVPGTGQRTGAPFGAGVEFWAGSGAGAECSVSAGCGASAGSSIDAELGTGFCFGARCGANMFPGTGGGASAGHGAAAVPETCTAGANGWGGAGGGAGETGQPGPVQGMVPQRWPETCTGPDADAQPRDAQQSESGTCLSEAQVDAATMKLPQWCSGGSDIAGCSK